MLWGQIEEERLAGILLNKLHRLLGVIRRELFLVLRRDLRIDDFRSLDQREMRPTLDALLHRQMPHARMIRPHVVRVRQPVVFIEAIVRW